MPVWGGHDIVIVMSESQNTKAEMPNLTSDDIIEWLKKNPDFLKKNPDAADHLIPPKDRTSGRSIVDFQHYMVEKLKADKKLVLDTTRDIIEVSRENMNNLARIHNAVLKVLEADNFDDFVQIITNDLGMVLDCDAVSLVIEDTQNVLPKSQSGLLKKVPAGTVDTWMDGNDARIQSGINGTEQIFGAAAGLVRSQALLRIDSQKQIPPAILAFGSRDPEMFRDGQGTDLIAFLCGVVERALKLWLSRPPQA